MKQPTHIDNPNGEDNRAGAKAHAQTMPAGHSSNKKNAANALTSIDLFSGCGGLTLGFRIL